MRRASIRRRVSQTVKRRATGRRVATALKKYLHQVNPSAKLAGAKVEKLKGGVLKITPIKVNAAMGSRRGDPKPEKRCLECGGPLDKNRKFTNYCTRCTKKQESRMGIGGRR